MSQEITLTAAADKYLKRLEKQQRKHAENIEDAIEDPSEDPRPHGCTALSSYLAFSVFESATIASATPSTMGSC
ncbi:MULTISPECIES: hypothetical protein [Actinoalloteichus]|uniref:Uncharacterized protein n=1 Tax=Actinoalloteichus fjordicus TaxID=1612552 RepID=A0AAC9LFY0_9PSEU|nr:MULTISPECIES: hypothetical protein [Actinoalloteichus]APU16966.1 hypothetical protein UA74_24760 [Actinoalloteichus fjordicus]APU23046.1 hypothetical protein UA75_25340 [Actinoalloteichus sp. GBA129-24]